MSVKPPLAKWSANTVKSTPNNPSVSKSKVISFTFSAPFCISIVLLPALKGFTLPVPNVVSRSTLTFVGVTGSDPAPPDKVNSALVVNNCKNLAGSRCLITLT